MVRGGLCLSVDRKWPYACQSSVNVKSSGSESEKTLTTLCAEISSVNDLRRSKSHKSNLENTSLSKSGT